MERLKKLRAAELILQGLVERSISPAKAVELWPELDDPEDELIAEAAHLLDHYYSDTDIHAKDSKYEEAQRDQFREILKRIRGQLGARA